ncbi:hypothetical protein ABQJ54_07980 [Rhodanobacter sp. Si-c]|uniref:Uncharacterized protein n=1 Tax=Rhodanobacter lycopersici TaxID=3162487 RepID=A0ABV3QDA9_9GAMM
MRQIEVKALRKLRHP